MIHKNIYNKILSFIPEIPGLAKDRYSLPPGTRTPGSPRLRDPPAYGGYIFSQPKGKNKEKRKGIDFEEAVGHCHQLGPTFPAGGWSRGGLDLHRPKG